MMLLILFDVRDVFCTSSGSYTRDNAETVSDEIGNSSDVPSANLLREGSNHVRVMSCHVSVFLNFGVVVFTTYLVPVPGTVPVLV